MKVVHSLALPVVGAAVVAGAISLASSEHEAPEASMSAQSAVAPTQVELGPTPSPLVAMVEAGRVAAAAEATAQSRATQARAAKISAADNRARQQRASRSRSSDPKSIAREMLSARGQSDQFSCLEQLWTRESRWRVQATNSSSGAYGIPQSLPASKMSSAGADWRTNARTQISWGLTYIEGRYGSPCAAWSHSESNGWY